MKTISSLIFGTILFFGAISAFANHIPMPNLPMGNEAIKITEAPHPCGKVTLYEFLDGGSIWGIWMLNGRWLMVDKDMEEFWIDKNLDAHLDEKVDNYMDFTIKYPELCDIIKKTKLP